MWPIADIYELNVIQNMNEQHTHTHIKFIASQKQIKKYTMYLYMKLELTKSNQFVGIRMQRVFFSRLMTIIYEQRQRKRTIIHLRSFFQS